MTELKTLKDIRTWSRGEHPLISIIDLKAEAVKWYKSDEIGKENMFGDCGEELRGFLEHFFNLSEEDLK
jgi:hypothetical protein